MKFHLANGVTLNRHNPTSFLIPNRASKKKLREGDMVKVMIKFGDRDRPKKIKGIEAERCWVRIVEADYPNFVGMLDTIPVVMGDISHEIYFRGENILAIYAEEEPS